MAKQHIISIQTEQDFINLMERIDDAEYILNSKIEAKNLSVHLKIEGTNFNSSLTGSIISALAEYQQNIYRIYKNEKYGKSSGRHLSDEEKRALEIKVAIHPGCTDAVIDFVKDIIPEVLNNMTGTETVIAIGVIMFAFAIKGIGVQLIQSIFKTKRNDVNAKLEVEKKEIEARLEEKKINVAKEKDIVYLNSINSFISGSMETMRSFSKNLKIANPEKLTINETEVTQEDLDRVSSDMVIHKEKVDEPKESVVSGAFKVLDINYEKELTTMKAEHIETKKIYENISLNDDWMTPENMAILKNAQYREPVIFKIIIKKQGRKYLSTIDVNSIKIE